MDRHQPKSSRSTDQHPPMASIKDCQGSHVVNMGDDTKEAVNVQGITDQPLTAETAITESLAVSPGMTAMERLDLLIHTTQTTDTLRYSSKASAQLTDHTDHPGDLFFASGSQSQRDQISCLELISRPSARDTQDSDVVIQRGKPRYVGDPQAVKARNNGGILVGNVYRPTPSDWNRGCQESQPSSRLEKKDQECGELKTWRSQSQSNISTVTSVGGNDVTETINYIVYADLSRKRRVSKDFTPSVHSTCTREFEREFKKLASNLDYLSSDLHESEDKLSKTGLQSDQSAPSSARGNDSDDVSESQEESVHRYTVVRRSFHKRGTINFDPREGTPLGAFSDKDNISSSRYASSTSLMTSNVRSSMGQSESHVMCKGSSSDLQGTKPTTLATQSYKNAQIIIATSVSNESKGSMRVLKKGNCDTASGNQPVAKKSVEISAHQMDYGIAVGLVGKPDIVACTEKPLKGHTSNLHPALQREEKQTATPSESPAAKEEITGAKVISNLSLGLSAVGSTNLDNSKLGHGQGYISRSSTDISPGRTLSSICTAGDVGHCVPMILPRYSSFTCLHSARSSQEASDGSDVYFVDGKPLKSCLRRRNINELPLPDLELPEERSPIIIRKKRPVVKPQTQMLKITLGKKVNTFKPIAQPLPNYRTFRAGSDIVHKPSARRLVPHPSGIRTQLKSWPRSKSVESLTKEPKAPNINSLSDNCVLVWTLEDKSDKSRPTQTKKKKRLSSRKIIRQLSARAENEPVGRIDDVNSSPAVNGVCRQSELSCPEGGRTSEDGKHAETTGQKTDVKMIDQQNNREPNKLLDSTNLAPFPAEKNQSPELTRENSDGALADLVVGLDYRKKKIKTRVLKVLNLDLLGERNHSRKCWQ